MIISLAQVALAVCYRGGHGQVEISERRERRGPPGEHVTQQAIAQSLATLKERGLVEKQADPSDGRKSLVTATATGRELMEGIAASREEWLTQAIDAAVRPEEHPLLAEEIGLLERIADVKLHRGGGIR